MTSWTDEQKRLRERVAGIGELLNADHVGADAASEFPREKWKIVADTGILGLPFPDRWGGLGHDLSTTMYVLEGLGYCCRDGGLNFSISTHIVSAGVPLHLFGSEELKDRYLPGVCSGEQLAAHAITESGSGSDALSMRTHARREADSYVLNGSKAFVTNGPVADLFVVYARTHPDGGPLGISAFLVERGRKGFEVGSSVEKMGLRTSPLGELHFDDCRLPLSHRIGREGEGYRILDQVMSWEILCSFVISVGEMQHRLERCIAHVRSRQQFGRSIGSFQSVANKIVRMNIDVRTARKWLFDTAERYQIGQSISEDISICKLLASEANVSTAFAAMQVHGGRGYIADYGIEKDLRNAVASTIYSGTSEIHANRIASLLKLSG